MKVKPEVYYEKIQKYDGTKDILWVYDANYPNTIRYFKDKANAAVEQGKNATIYKKKAEIYEKLLENSDKFYYDYQLGWRKLIHTVRNMGTYIGGIIILIALAGMFADERSTKFDSILLTTKYGRNKLITAKLIVGMILTVLYWFLVNIIIIASHFLVYGLDGFKSAIQLDINYMNVAYEMSIGTFFIVVLFLNLLGGFLLSTLTMFISTKFKSAFITLIISAVIFFIPVVRTNVEFIDDMFLFTPLKIMDGTAQMYSQCYNIFGRAITQLPTIIIFAVTVTIALIGLTYHSFKKAGVVN